MRINKNRHLRRSSRGLQLRDLYPSGADKPTETEFVEDIPRKYRRSLKKITLLQE